MTLILIQIIVRSIGSTLQWLGFNAGIRALPGGQYRQTRWMVGSAIVFAAWLFAIVLLASQNVFRTEVGSLSVPIVAYWLYARKPWARRAAIAWNLFGMADLINAVMLGALTGGGGIAFPTVLIPVHDAPAVS